MNWEQRKRWLKTSPGKTSHERAQKAYRINHPDRIKYDGLRYRSKRHGMPFLITKEEFSAWYFAQPPKCVYCDIVDLTLDEPCVDRGVLTIFSIDRKNPDLPYTIENMCFSCWRCNRLKSDGFSHDEWRDIAQKYLKPKWIAKVQAAMK